MKVKNSISTTMRTLKGKETKDKAAKNIFSYKPIMGNILKYTVAEYSDCSLEEIINCIEGDTIQTGTAFVEEDMAGSIRGELQKNYRPGYPVIKRGIYYGCRKLSSQLDKVGKNGKGYKYLEKVYSIWICLDNIPKEQQNTVSYYKIHNYKNEGFRVLDIQIDAAEADLMEIVIVRLGGGAQNEKGLMDLLYGVFSGDQKKVLSYIPDSDSQIRQKEVSDMLSMISYAEERGEKKGEDRLGTLMKILLDAERYADAKRASKDETYREQLYKEFKI